MERKVLKYSFEHMYFYLVAKSQVKKIFKLLQEKGEGWAERKWRD
jgi:hypothetical protein